MKDSDKQLVYNLRFAYHELINHVSDEELVKTYDEFIMSDDFPNEDIFVKEWLPPKPERKNDAT